MSLTCTLPLKLITFDATNTLLRFKVPPWSHYASKATNYGFKGTEEELKTTLINNMREMSAMFPNFGRDTLCWEEWWKQLVIKTFSNLINRHADIKKLSCELINDYKSPVCWELAPGTQKLMSYLKTNRNLKIGIISNFDPRLHEIAVNLGFRQHLDFIMTSYECGAMKPSVFIFDHTLRTYAPEVAPNEALHVGDDYEKDYEGASRAGWHARLISNDIKKSSCLPKHHVFGSFEELVVTVTNNRMEIDQY